VWTMLGQAAGVAAAMAIQAGIAVQDVPVEKLKRALIQKGAILDAKPFNEYWPRAGA